MERWIEVKGSRENELRDAELLVVVAVCQRVECRVIGVESHWLNQVRLSASGGLLSRGLRSGVEV